MLWPGAWAAPRSSWEEADVSAAEQHGVIHSEESWAFTLNSATGLLLGCSVSSFPGKADLLLKTWLRFTPEKFCRSTSGCNEPIILIYPHKIGKYLSPCRNFHKTQWFNSSLITRLRMHPSSDQLIQLKNSGKLSSTWSSTCYVCRLTQFNLIKYSLFTQRVLGTSSSCINGEGWKKKSLMWHSVFIHQFSALKCFYISSENTPLSLHLISD